MARSQNGWPAYTNGAHPDLVAIEEIAGRVHKRVAVIFQHFNARFHREVEAITEAAGQPQNDWGFANRPIRGGVATSNHGSATAEDLNADKHPLGKVGTFTPAQYAAYRRLLNDFGGVLRSGIDYVGRKDEMHVEINVGPDSPAIEALTNLILSHGGPGSISGGGIVLPPISPRPPAAGGLAPGYPLAAGRYFGPEGGGKESVSGYHHRRSNGAVGHDSLYAFQNRMRQRGWSKMMLDGLYGPRGATEPRGNCAEITLAFQTEKGLKRDSVIGPQTWAAAWTAPVT